MEGQVKKNVSVIEICQHLGDQINHSEYEIEVCGEIELL